MTALFGKGSSTFAQPSPSRLRFNLAIQKNRAVVFSVAAILGFVCAGPEILKHHYLDIFGIIFFSNLSALLMTVYYRRQLRGKPGRNLDILWIIIDSLLITWGVNITGGAESAWFPWYLANISGAAFAMGQLAAFFVFLWDTLIYVCLAWSRGESAGFDRVAFQVLFKMVCLYGASFFFLKGAMELNRKRLAVKKLKENETRKVEELTRLTQVLDQKSRELAEANRKVEESNRLKSQFMANMSHELRTPLNSIVGFSEVLLTRLEGEISARYTKFLSNIHTSGQHLLRIINDILDLSKIEAGQVDLHPEAISVRDVADGVCTIMRSLAVKRKIRFLKEIPDNLPPLHADPVKYKQILYNLVSNAVKFSPDDSKVEIRARYLSQEASSLNEESIQVDVVDHGIGIDPRDHHKVFQEFRQVDGTLTRKYEGTGLGLSLVKRFVEIHGGEITLTSRPGEGSTFSVVLPRICTGAKPIPPLGESPPTFTADGRKRILVVEDDPTAYESLSRDLESEGYTCLRAKNGEEAIRSARQLKPDAITLDIIMPGMDGWEVLKRLKEIESTRDIPVIIISMQENRELGIALGANDYLVKPVDRDLLLERLTRMIPPGLPSQSRILLIDDDPHLHEMLEAVLEIRGYRVSHALTGGEGVRVAVEAPPDLIVLDLMMEGMDGFEVAAVLQGEAVTSKVPILVLTAKDLTADDRERLRGKITALVQKGDGGPANLPGIIHDLLTAHSREKSDG